MFNHIVLSLIKRLNFLLKKNINTRGDDCQCRSFNNSFQTFYFFCLKKNCFNRLKFNFGYILIYSAEKIVQITVFQEPVYNLEKKDVFRIEINV